MTAKRCAGALQLFIAEPSMDRRVRELSRPAERHGGRESETLEDVEVERRSSAKQARAARVLSEVEGLRRECTARQWKGKMLPANSIGECRESAAQRSR